MVRFKISLVHLCRFHVYDNGILGPAVDRVVEVVRSDLDDELSFDAGAEAVEEAGLDACLVLQGRSARILRQVGLVHILVAVTEVGPELTVEETCVRRLIARRRPYLRIVSGALRMSPRAASNCRYKKRQSGHGRPCGDTMSLQNPT